MPDTYFVAPDALSRLEYDKPQDKVFTVNWWISGELHIKAANAAEAYRKAIMFSKQGLAITGELEMSDPEEQGSVQ